MFCNLLESSFLSMGSWNFKTFAGQEVIEPVFVDHVIVMWPRCFSHRITQFCDITNIWLKYDLIVLIMQWSYDGVPLSSNSQILSHEICDCHNILIMLYHIICCYVSDGHDTLFTLGLQKIANFYNVVKLTNYSIYVIVHVHCLVVVVSLK